MTSSADSRRFARVWRGRVSKEKADAYERYWLETGSAPLLAKGAVSVQMLREDRDSEVEFTTISWWPSVEAMAPDGDPYRTHHLKQDREFLIELPNRVQILKLLETREASPLDDTE